MAVLSYVADAFLYEQAAVGFVFTVLFCVLLTSLMLEGVSIPKRRGLMKYVHRGALAAATAKVIAYAIDPHSVLGIYPLAWVELLRDIPRCSWIIGVAEATMKLATTLQLHSYQQARFKCVMAMHKSISRFSEVTAVAIPVILFVVGIISPGTSTYTAAQTLTLAVYFGLIWLMSLTHLITSEYVICFIDSSSKAVNHMQHMRKLSEVGVARTIRRVRVLEFFLLLVAFCLTALYVWLFVTGQADAKATPDSFSSSLSELAISWVVVLFLVVSAWITWVSPSEDYVPERDHSTTVSRQPSFSRAQSISRGSSSKL